MFESINEADGSALAVTDCINGNSFIPYPQLRICACVLVSQTVLSVNALLPSIRLSHLVLGKWLLLVLFPLLII
jgi:hypothetical protein